MAFLKGNTYVDGDLIVNGNIQVDTMSSSGVKYAQLVDPTDGYLAVTTSSGDLKKSTIQENVSNDTTTYTLGSISKVNVPEKKLTVDSAAIQLNTPVDRIIATGIAGTLTWVYEDGTRLSSSVSPTGAKPDTSNPVIYPIGVTLVV